MMEAKLKQKEACIPDDVGQNLIFAAGSLRFSSRVAEDGYIKSHAQDLIKHGRIGCFSSAFALLVIATLGKLAKPDASLEQWYFVLPHVVIFGLLGLACCSSQILNRIGFTMREIMCVTGLMLSIIEIVLMAPAYDRAMQRSSAASDSAVVLSLVITILGTHVLLPIRWFLLVPLQIFSVLAYVFYILVNGNLKHIPEDNLLLFGICVLLLSFGTRSAEIRSRESFAHVVIARTLRAEAEFRAVRQQSSEQFRAEAEFRPPIAAKSTETTATVAGLYGQSNPSPSSVLSLEQSNRNQTNQSYQSTPSSLDYSISVLGTSTTSDRGDRTLANKLRSLQSFNKETQTMPIDFPHADAYSSRQFSSTMLSTRPPLPPQHFTGDDQCSSASSQTLERQFCGEKLMASCIEPTSLKICWRSLQQHIKHWNLGYDSSACCPFHAATRVCGVAFRKLSRQQCNPLWSPFLGWSCISCTCANHRQALHCAVCGHPRFLSPQTTLACGEMSLTFNAYSGKVINCSHTFSHIFGDHPPGSLCFSLFKPVQPFWKVYQTHVDDVQNIVDAQADADGSDCSAAMEMVTSSFSHVVILEQPSSGFLPIQYEATCNATLDMSEDSGLKDCRETEEFGVTAHIVLKDLKLCRSSKNSTMSL